MVASNLDSASVVQGQNALSDLRGTDSHVIPRSDGDRHQATSPTDINRTDISTGLKLFMEHISTELIFIHHPTFDESSIPEPLMWAMICLGFQYCDDVSRGKTIALECFHRACQLIDTQQGWSSATHILMIIQTYLMLEVYAILYACGSKTAIGLQMHTKAVEVKSSFSEVHSTECIYSCQLARRNGLMDPLPTQPQSTADLESLWLEFVRAESHKRCGSSST